MATHTLRLEEAESQGWLKGLVVGRHRAETKLLVFIPKVVLFLSLVCLFFLSLSLEHIKYKRTLARPHTIIEL